jgi:hypothetical protein
VQLDRDEAFENGAFEDEAFEIDLWTESINSIQM